MNIEGLEGIPCITRSDFLQPLFRVVTVKPENGQYIIIDNRPLWGAVVGQPFGFGGERVNIGVSITDFMSQRLRRLMLSLDRQGYMLQDQIERLKQGCNLTQPPLEFFGSHVNEKNEVHIDRILNRYPEFRARIAPFCQDLLEVRINPDSLEEVYTAAAYILFGPYVVDYEWEAAGFLSYRVRKILERMDVLPLGTNDNAAEPDCIVAFDRRIQPLVQQNWNRDQRSFLKRLDDLTEYGYCSGEIMVALIPNIYLLEVHNDSGEAQTRYLEVPELLDRVHFTELGAVFGQDPPLKSPMSVNVVSSDDLGLNNHLDLRRKVWLELPDRKLGTRNLRNAFTNALDKRFNVYGLPVEPRPNQYNEKQLIALIEYAGLHGVTKRTEATILNDPIFLDEQLGDSTIAQLKRRARRGNKLGVDFNLFT